MEDKREKLQKILAFAVPLSDQSRPESSPKAQSRRKSPTAASQAIDGDQNVQTGGGNVKRQTIKGNGNVQVGGSVSSINVRSGGRVKIELTPALGSIGANAALRARIEGLLKEINDARYERIGATYKFAALYGSLAKAFGLKSAEWKNIWLWHEFRAPEVIAWLEGARDNTQAGRIKKAAKGAGYKHTRPHLFRLEGDYLGQLGMSDEDALATRQLITGKSSRKDMTDNEFSNWVGYLARKVELMYGETGN